MGYAFAGVADDPSAIYYNPGGLTNVKGWQMMVGASILDINTEHTAKATGVNDEMASNYPVVPFFYLSQSREGSPWAFGLGINSPWGLVTEWKDDSFSRTYATESKVLMYQVNPTVAYALNDALSLGVGLDYVNIFETELNQRLPSLLNGSNEGHSKLTADGTAWGYNLGLHMKANDRHSFGLAYRSQVNVPVEGDLEIKDAATYTGTLLAGSSFNSGARTVLTFPQKVLLGYAFKASDRWTFSADYEWANWSRVENTKIEYQNPGSFLGGETNIRRDWKNNSNIGLGAEFAASDRLDLRFGAFAYERAVPSYTLESSIPDAGRFGLTVGSGFHLGRTTIDLGYNAIFFSDRDIDNNQGNALSGSLDGKYETMAHVLSFAVSQKFGGAN